MRYRFKFSPSTEDVPNNLEAITSYLHKCLGEGNEYHDKPSKYVVSRMLGGTVCNGGRSIKFPKGGSIFISSGDQDFLGKCVKGIMQNPDFGFGMKMQGFEFVEAEFYDGFNVMKTTDSGIFLKNNTQGRYQYHTIKDPDFVQRLQDHTMKRLKHIEPGLDWSGFSLEIRKHKNHKTRTVRIHGSNLDTSVFLVVVHGKAEVAQAIHNYGLGQSTGIGVGMVMDVSNSKMYI